MHFFRLYVYWKSGRNLHHPRGYDQRLYTLKKGKLNVVALLTELPPSRHDPQSFAVDLTVFTVRNSLTRIVNRLINFHSQ